MSKEIQKWADPAMFEAEPVEKNERGEVRPKVYLLQATPDPLGGIAATCMMYEGRVVRSLREITDEERRHYWAEANSTHLKAPLEFVQLHFMIEGVTRAFTHQMVRQRTATYAQESMRFAVKEDLVSETTYPPSVEGTPFAADWDAALEAVQEVYERMVNNGIPAEDARGLMPHAVTTRLHYRTSLKDLIDHAGNRLCTQAQFEWRYVFAELLKALRAQSDVYGINGPVDGGGVGPSNWQWRHIIDSDVFRPVCFAKGKCPFKADFDRACTIRERADSGRFDEIRPEEWLLDPAAARRGD